VGAARLVAVACRRRQEWAQPVCTQHIRSLGARRASAEGEASLKPEQTQRCWQPAAHRWWCRVRRHDRCRHVRRLWWLRPPQSRAGANTALPRAHRSSARRPRATPPMCRTTWRRAGAKEGVPNSHPLVLHTSRMWRVRGNPPPPPLNPTRSSNPTRSRELLHDTPTTRVAVVRGSHNRVRARGGALESPRVGRSIYRAVRGRWRGQVSKRR